MLGTRLSSLIPSMQYNRYVTILWFGNNDKLLRLKKKNFAFRVFFKTVISARIIS